MNLSRDVTRKEYVQHADGTYSSQCLTELPSQLLDGLALHEHLDVSFNVLATVPDELPLRLPHLVCLRLSHNCISWLPDSIALFFHLRTLAVDHNRLTSLPATLAGLVKLRLLDVSHNQLTALPANIGSLESLTRLNVAHNRLRTLPLSLASCQPLTVLLARSNALVAPAQELCDVSSEATIAALRKLLSSAQASNGLPALRVVCSDAPKEFPRFRAAGRAASPAVGVPEHRASLQARYADSVLFPPNRPRTPLIAPPGASALDACTLRERIVGLFYGAAVGDAMALATEQLTADECRFHYSNPSELRYSAIIRDEYRTQWKRGDWSTDFDLVALVLDSLLQWAGVVDELDYASRLADWNSRGFPALGDTESITFSNTIAKVCEHPLFLKDPHSAAKQVLSDSLLRSHAEDVDLGEFLDEYADDAALARSIVLGIPSFHDLNEVTENSARICRSTHWDRRCVAAAAFVSSCVALLLQGVPTDTTDDMHALMSRAAGFAAEKYLNENERQAFEDCCCGRTTALQKPSSQHFVLRSLSLASKAVLEHSKFRPAMVSIMMGGGHCKTAACLVGAILGCRHGYSALPSHWVNELQAQQTEWLNAKLNWLLDIMGIP